MQLYQGPWTSCPNDSMYRMHPCPPASSNVPDVINFNVFFSINAQGRLLSDVVAIDHKFKPDSNGKIGWYGPHDPRFFTWGSDVYLAFNAPTREHANSRGMWIHRLFPTQTEPVFLTGFPSPQWYEKNWAPVGPYQGIIDDCDDDEYLFTRFVEPHEVLRCNRAGNCKVAGSTSHAAFFERYKKTHLLRSLHLGTNAVRVSEKYYGAIFHGVQFTPGEYPKYQEIPYLFEAEAPYEIKYVTVKPLDLPRNVDGRDPSQMYTFSTGLTFVDGKLVVSYGIADNYSRFYVTTVDAVFGNLVALVE